MMNDIYLEYILQEEKDRRTKGDYRSYNFLRRLLYRWLCYYLFLQRLLHFRALNSVHFHLVSDLCL